MRRFQKFERLFAARRVTAVPVADASKCLRLVEDDPLLHAIPERTRHDVRVLRETRGGVGQIEAIHLAVDLEGDAPSLPGKKPPEQCREACGLAAKMAEAEAAWRQSLRTVTIADIVASLPRGVPERTRALLARPR